MSCIGQWTPVPTSLFTDYVEYVTEEVLFLSGYTLSDPVNGYILKSTNGGTTFSEVWHVPDGHYGVVHFINNQKGFIAGDMGGQAVVHKTENGGLTWDTTELDAYIPDFEDMFFINDYIGFLCGGFGGGYLFKTTNGGATWNKIFNGYGDKLIDIQFFGDHEGWLGVSDGVILHTIGEFFAPVVANFTVRQTEAGYGLLLKMIFRIIFFSGMSSLSILMWDLPLGLTMATRVY
jgi:photosystem II stability/assembly factor-like uncharacterized protein